MTLGFSTHWPDRMGGGPTHFVEKIWEGIRDPNDNSEILFYSDNGKRFDPYSAYAPKIHTIREDKHDRWEAGNLIHMALEHTTMSLSTIGPYAGVDHAGVIHYRKNVIPSYRDCDEHFLPMLEECQDVFLGTTTEQRHDIEALKERIAELTEKLARTKRPLIARMALLPDDTFKALEERVRPILLFLEKQ